MAEGQFTGTRTSYIYTPDSGDATYIITTDTTLGGLAGTGLTVATTGNTANASPVPKRFKPRVVFWSGTLNNKPVRKQIICGTVSSTLYDKDTPQALTIDGVAGSTTGRRGEKVSFPKLGTAAPAP